MTLVELMLVPGPSESAGKGFGVNVATIRPLEYSLYSYLNPLGLALLPGTLDASTELAVSLLAKGAAIQAMIEPSAVSFFAPVSRKAYLTALSDGTTRFHSVTLFLLLTRSSGMYRLSSTAPPAVPSIHEVDIREEDLLRYTNAGGHVGYAIFLMDLAAAAGALSVFVVCDKYFQV